jgi:hypothetical protein
MELEIMDFKEVEISIIGQYGQVVQHFNHMKQLSGLLIVNLVHKLYQSGNQ